MKDLPIIWLLLNTTIGKIIIGLFVIFVVVSIFGWWLVPIIAGLIAIILFYLYYKRKEKKMLVPSICFGAIALASAIYINKEILFDYDPYPDKYRPYYQDIQEELIITDTANVVDGDMLDTENTPKSEVSESIKSSASSSHDSHHNDNMRGFDPASEDDTHDNGMSRYMENYDDEGWD